MTKHQSLVIDSWGDNEPNFEELVEEDTDYLVFKCASDDQKQVL